MIEVKNCDDFSQNSKSEKKMADTLPNLLHKNAIIQIKI